MRSVAPGAISVGGVTAATRSRPPGTLQFSVASAGAAPAFVTSMSCVLSVPCMKQVWSSSSTSWGVTWTWSCACAAAPCSAAVSSRAMGRMRAMGLPLVLQGG